MTAFLIMASGPIKESSSLEICYQVKQVQRSTEKESKAYKNWHLRRNAQQQIDTTDKSVTLTSSADLDRPKSQILTCILDVKSMFSDLMSLIK